MSQSHYVSNNTQIMVKRRPYCFVSCHRDFVQQPTMESSFYYRNLLIWHFMWYTDVFTLFQELSLHLFRFPRTNLPVLLYVKLSKFCPPVSHCPRVHADPYIRPFSFYEKWTTKLVSSSDLWKVGFYKVEDPGAWRLFSSIHKQNCNSYSLRSLSEGGYHQSWV